MDFFNAFAFGVGMVALLNPCGFGLLPAYLGFFLAQDDDDSGRWVALNRAQGVGLAMTLGMLTVFGFFGLILGGLQAAVATRLPYFNIALGVGLFVLGVAMLRGHRLRLRIPKLQKGGSSGSFVSMFLFGMSYATASLTCTLGLFITAVNSGSISSGPDGGGFGSSFGALVSYGLGMGLLATMITLFLALGKRGLVNRFRSVLPKIDVFSAILLLIVGPYSIGYGIWELQVLGEWPLGDGVWPFLASLNEGIGGIQSDVSGWFSTDAGVLGGELTRAELLGYPFVLVNLIIIAGGFLARRRAGAVVTDPLEAAGSSVGGNDVVGTGGPAGAVDGPEASGVAATAETAGTSHVASAAESPDDAPDHAGVASGERVTA